MWGSYYKKLFEIDIWFSCNLWWPFFTFYPQHQKPLSWSCSHQTEIVPPAASSFGNRQPLAVLTHKGLESFVFLIFPISLEMHFSVSYLCYNTVPKLTLVSGSVFSFSLQSPERTILLILSCAKLCFLKCLFSTKTVIYDLCKLSQPLFSLSLKVQIPRVTF